MPNATVDVVESFVYDSENKRYNEAHRKWRSRTQGSFLFRYRGNSRENTYTEGRTLAAENAAAAERRALRRTGERLGAALLVCFCCEMIGGTALIWLLGTFGFNIRLDFLTFSMHGSQWTTTAVRILLSTMKFGIPSLILISLFRLPRRVFFPLRPGSVPEITAAAGAGMLIAALFTLLSHKEGVELAERILAYKSTEAVFAYGLYEAVVVSVLAELMLRGCALQVLRQFGDPFALSAAALIGFLLPNTLPMRVAELLIGLAAGYLMLRSGSLVKCVLVRAVFITLSYARLVLVYSGGTMPLWSFVLTLFSAGTIAAAFFAIRRASRLRLHNIHTGIPAPVKLAQLIATVTMLPWTAASLLLALVQLYF